MTQQEIPGTGGLTRPTGRHRILEVDALRGFALGGIFLSNVLVMAGIDGQRAGGPQTSGIDLVAVWLVTVLVQSKFYLLFSFLFGYSFTLQMTSAARAGARFAPRMLRRLLGLFVLGLLHAALLYTGDILTTYAVLGLVLLACRNTAPERALRAALGVYGVVAVLFLLLGAAGAMFPATDGELQAQTADLTAAYHGDAADAITANIAAWPDVIGGLFVGGGPVVVAFLTGFAAGKRNLVADVARRPGLLRKLCVYGFAIGLPGSLFMAAGLLGPLSHRWETLGLVVGILTAPALSAAYVSGLLLWFGRERGAATAARLAPAGRVALTHYLLQSLAMALVFTGYGLRLYGHPGAAAVLGGALALYALQIAVSAPFLRRFRAGPAEWLLRALTVAGGPAAAAVADGASVVQDTRHAAGP
ncbi:DUF418 domain-containing protein [Streptomyces sp. NPDC002911]